ncbi:MAG: hypothetical protein IJA84_04290 [Clostridia bacterium]|nr:hypothetical protein [Clostridia bacterium]
MIVIRCLREQDETWVRRLIHQRRLAAEVRREGAWDVLIDGMGCVRGGGQAITCGMDRRDTLTVSSLLQNGGMATLQRQIHTLDGRPIEPRELSLEGLSGEIGQKLTAAALLLLLDEKN